MSELAKYLEDVRLREQAATKGEWSIVNRGLSTDWDLEGPEGGHIKGAFWHQADAQFCASARADVPKLLRIIECYKSYASANAFSPHVYANMQAELDQIARQR